MTWSHCRMTEVWVLSWWSVDMAPADSMVSSAQQLMRPTARMTDIKAIQSIHTLMPSHLLAYACGCINFVKACTRLHSSHIHYFTSLIIGCRPSVWQPIIYFNVRCFIYTLWALTLCSRCIYRLAGHAHAIHAYIERRDVWEFGIDTCATRNLHNMGHLGLWLLLSQ